MLRFLAEGLIQCNEFYLQLLQFRKVFIFYKDFNKNCAVYWAYLRIQCTSRFVIYARIKKSFCVLQKNKMQTTTLLSECKKIK